MLVEILTILYLHNFKINFHHHNHHSQRVLVHLWTYPSPSWCIRFCQLFYSTFRISSFHLVFGLPGFSFWFHSRFHLSSSFFLFPARFYVSTCLRNLFSIICKWPYLTSCFVRMLSILLFLQFYGWWLFLALTFLKPFSSSTQHFLRSFLNLQNFWTICYNTFYDNIVNKPFIFIWDVRIPQL